MGEAASFKDPNIHPGEESNCEIYQSILFFYKARKWPALFKVDVLSKLSMPSDSIGKGNDGMIK